MKELDDGALKRWKLFVRRSRGHLRGAADVRNKPVDEEEVPEMVCREVVINRRQCGRLRPQRDNLDRQ
jgi:hypothetical protein